MSDAPHLQFLRRMPTRRVAAIDDVACRLQRGRSLRPANGAGAWDATIRASSLFRRNRSGAQTRILKLPISPHDDDWHLPLPAGDIDRDLAAVAPEHNVGLSMLRLQPAHMQLVEEIRHHRAVEPDLFATLFETRTEAGLNEREYGGARPGLRRAGNRIERRRRQPSPRKAAEQLGQPP